MRTLKIMALLVFLLNSYLHAQSDQSRTIEVNNENGELFISFENGNITEFVLNDMPVPEERYEDYQDIIDDFCEEEFHLDNQVVPDPAVSNVDQNERLNTAIVDYLFSENLIASVSKYNIELKRKLLKVNGTKMSNQYHNQCLDIFQKIYGHPLNFNSGVRFKKSRNSFSSSVSITD